MVARARGFEPRSKVLETSILPLNYARILPNKKVKVPFDLLRVANVSLFFSKKEIKNFAAKNFRKKNDTRFLLFS